MSLSVSASKPLRFRPELLVASLGSRSSLLADSPSIGALNSTVSYDSSRLSNQTMSRIQSSQPPWTFREFIEPAWEFIEPAVGITCRLLPSTSRRSRTDSSGTSSSTCPPGTAKAPSWGCCGRLGSGRSTPGSNGSLPRIEKHSPFATRSRCVASSRPPGIRSSGAGCIGSPATRTRNVASRTTRTAIGSRLALVLERVRADIDSYVWGIILSSRRVPGVCQSGRLSSERCP
jgi:hypothetical protein